MSTRDRQPAYAVHVTDSEMKRKMADSGLCMITDWGNGYFKVPEEFKDRFLKRFGSVVSIAEQANRVCIKNITMAEISRLNNMYRRQDI